MSIIRILPDEIANRIAAGEVIERPASVVKELIENALDAGADRISVRIADGGAKLIQVSDNGCGMNRDDALLCIEAHATSKIRDSADIDCIRTLGFRGEALPSIASVSHFELQTRPPDAVEGSEILVDGGTLRDVRDCGCPPGTTIRVKRLFHNMPARRKFLRRKTTEEGHIHETVLLHALGMPSVAFELNADGRRLLQVAAGTDHRARAGMLLGRETASGLLDVSYREGEIQVSGFAARPGVTRGSRREQRIFVNGRPAAAPVLFAALREAYEGLVVKGRYAPVLLYLELPPDQVDVNVHPGKKEVRFRDPSQVKTIVLTAIVRALRELTQRNQPVPPAQSPSRTAPPPGAGGTTEVPSPRPLPESVRPRAETPHLPWHPAPEPSPPSSRNEPTGPQHETAKPPDTGENSAVDAITDATMPQPETDNPVRAIRILGSFHDGYLVGEGDTGLVLIDQRAAHERILYERLLAQTTPGAARRQPLLMPVTLEMPPARSALLNRQLERFAELGFTVEAFGSNTFLIRSAPAQVANSDLTKLIDDMLAELEEGGSPRQRVDTERLAAVASRCAVPTAKTLSETERDRLLADLARTDMPYTAPDGRPVMVNIPNADIARRFGKDRNTRRAVPTE